MERNTVISRAAAEIASAAGASAIILLSDIDFVAKTDIPLIVATHRPTMLTDGSTEETVFDMIAAKAAAASEHVQHASMIARISGMLNGDVVVAVVSQRASDMIILHDLRENRLIDVIDGCEERIDLKVLYSVLNVALEIASEGREKSRVGTAFIIGDSDEVMARSHQLVLNPFQGHADCSINDQNNWETIKAFAVLDGAFVIGEDGAVLAAGRYLDIDARDIHLKEGLGGRHTAAAAITRDTEAVAVTVSESGGVVRIYRDGLEIMEIEPELKLTKI